MSLDGVLPTQDRTLTCLAASCFLSKHGCRGNGRPAEEDKASSRKREAETTLQSLKPSHLNHQFPPKALPPGQDWVCLCGRLETTKSAQSIRSLGFEGGYLILAAEECQRLT